ncbi:MAG: hypothetical protein GY757_21035, partial [bacterium]|nr:hypothetical protein [bacterium]
MMNKFILLLMLLILTTGCTPKKSSVNPDNRGDTGVQAPKELHISGELMAKASPIELSGFNWKYHPATPAGVTGDNREWTDPQFDDSSWGPVPE